jgi:hypothetical protein
MYKEHKSKREAQWYCDYMESTLPEGEVTTKWDIPHKTPRGTWVTQCHELDPKASPFLDEWQTNVVEKRGVPKYFFWGPLIVGGLSLLYTVLHHTLGK